MAKSPKTWQYAPAKPKPVPLPSGLTHEVEEKANAQVATFFKPRFVLPPPEDPRFNYIEDIYIKWYRNSLYFCSRYRLAGLHKPEGTFETKFSRMKHMGGGLFDLAYMRYTGQWVAMYTGLTLDACIESIQNDPWFLP